MKKTVFIIPGFKHNPKQKAYKAIAKMLKKEGYESFFVSIPWKQTTISENTKHFLKTYKKINRKKKYILGFSFGAMIAFLASTKVRASGLVLCSLSPYFKEDITKIPAGVSITSQRYEDFSQLHCASLAKQIKTKQVLMLYGTREAKPLVKRVADAYDHISSRQKYLIAIDKTEHNIADPRYLDTIHQVVRVLH